ncbi:hypothetical protein HDU87_007728 [Geranomyces variabilis]|uniref:Uncharacterized protein n=1 Tax=Geranomyces variabilis TaxID=109894 RepID=A0AAD5XJI1_9FUNG|nr:hypothetical protein HDU87_007728 [Geranomyces variabilis]
MLVLDNYYLVNKVVDALWDELVVLFDLKLYGALVLVNGTFKSVLYQPHRRNEVLRALTARSLTSTVDRLHTRRLLRNPMLPPLEFIARYVTDDGLNPFPKLKELFARHANDLVSLLPEAVELDGAPPSFVAVHTGRIYASKMKRFISHPGKKVFLMGNLRAPNQKYWKFAVLVLVDDEEQDDDAKWGIYARNFWSTRDDGGTDEDCMVDCIGWKGPLSPHFD